MNSKKLKALIELVRPLNVLLIMLVIGASALVAGKGDVLLTHILVAAIAGGFIGAAANAINDYFDLEIDRVNKPHRPLPRGVLSRRDAKFLWLILSIIGVSFNLFLHWHALIIAVVAVVLLYWYSAALKGTVLLGNLTVSFMTGLALVYGGVVAGSPEASYLPGVFAFLVNLGREIIKDIEDMEGDRAAKALTLPVRYGPKSAAAVATVSLVGLVVVTIVAYEAGIYTQFFLYPVLVVDAVLVYVIMKMWRDPTPRAMGALSSLLKGTMVLGLAALWAGS